MFLPRFFKLFALFDLEYPAIKYSSQIEEFRAQERGEFIIYKIYFN